MSEVKAELVAVTKAARELEEARQTFRAEAELWIEERLFPSVMALERAVVDALEEGHAVTTVATAYTISGRTPNRNAIYNIQRRFKEDPDRDITVEYPFEWVPRVVNTRKGETIVFDIHATLSDFGPDEISGDFTWRYDAYSNEVEPVLTRENPYPITTKFYSRVLTRWLAINPIPGG